MLLFSTFISYVDSGLIAGGITTSPLLISNLEPCQGTLVILYPNLFRSYLEHNLEHILRQPLGNRNELNVGRDISYDIAMERWESEMVFDNINGNRSAFYQSELILLFTSISSSSFPIGFRINRFLSIAL